MNPDIPRFTGTLKKWNVERGFGFVAVDQGGQELFVHVSAFVRDGRVPLAGEALSFEVERDKEGRKRAVRVRRPGDVLAANPSRGAGHGPTAHTRRRPAHSMRPMRSNNSSSSWLGPLLGLLLVASLGVYGYVQFSARAEAARLAPAAAAEPAFVCDGREYCSQMTSCWEAKQFLKHCPDSKMDGNRDGVPCEQQWCTGSSRH